MSFQLHMVLSNLEGQEDLDLSVQDPAYPPGLQGTD